MAVSKAERSGIHGAFPPGKRITKAAIEAEKARLGYSPGDSTNLTRLLDGFQGVVVPKNYDKLYARLKAIQPPPERIAQTRRFLATNISPENANAQYLYGLPDTLALRYRAPRSAAANKPQAWGKLLGRILADIDTTRARLQSIGRGEYAKNANDPVDFDETVAAARAFVAHPGSPVAAAKLRHETLYALCMLKVSVDYIEILQKRARA